MPGEGRERCLSLPLLQTLSHRCCGDPDLAFPSCVPGEMPKMDQRAMETSRQRFPGGKQAVSGVSLAGTLEQLAGTWSSGVTAAVWGPELSSPLPTPGRAQPVWRFLHSRFGAQHSLCSPTRAASVGAPHKHGHSHGSFGREQVQPTPSPFP